MLRLMIYLAFFSTMFITVASVYVGRRIQKKQIAEAQRPSNHRILLMRTAESEHELEMLPHTDPDVLNACHHLDCQDPFLVKDERGRRLYTEQEARSIAAAREGKTYPPKPPPGSGGGSRNLFMSLEEESWREHKRLLEKEIHLKERILELKKDNELFMRALAAFKSYEGAVLSEDLALMTPNEARELGYSRGRGLPNINVPFVPVGYCDDHNCNQTGVNPKPEVHFY